MDKPIKFYQVSKNFIKSMFLFQQTRSQKLLLFVGYTMCAFKFLPMVPMVLYQWYQIAEIDVQYIGENFMNETVEVNTWEHENEHYTAYFVIRKKVVPLVKTVAYHWENLKHTLN